MKSKRSGIIVKLGEKKSKCRDGTDGDSEAETANAVSEQQEPRGSFCRGRSVQERDQCAGVGVYRSGISVQV